MAAMVAVAARVRRAHAAFTSEIRRGAWARRSHGTAAYGSVPVTACAAKVCVNRQQQRQVHLRANATSRSVSPIREMQITSTLDS
jgi:hypothetical protein